MEAMEERGEILSLLILLKTMFVKLSTNLDNKIHPDDKVYLSVRQCMLISFGKSPILNRITAPGLT